MNATSRAAEWRRYGLWSGIALSVVVATEFVGADPARLLDRDGWSNAVEVLSGFAHPDLSADFLRRILALSVESLLIGVLGTVLAVAVGAAIALVTIRVPDLPSPPKQAPASQRLGFEVLRTLGRWVLGFLRSIPEIVWAYLFVRLFGLGAIPAILAIGLTVGGSIGKLYSELAEAVDPRTALALRAMGSRRSSILLFSVIPQVARQWIAYALFRLECNIRSGTILGVVGAGGLGSEIALAIRYFQYDKLATALFAVLTFVIALEFVSAWLRRSPSRYTFAAAGLSTVAALAVLDLPWSDLANPAGATLIAHAVPVQWGFVRTAARLVVDTLAMAWVATAVSALIAFVLAPLSATQLTTGSYLADPLRISGLAAAARRLAQWLSRGFLQVTRAMPELTLALVFVVWVGAGPLAGIMAIAVHNAGVLGRLYSDVLEEVEAGTPAALQAMGAGSLGTFLFAVLPQVRARLAAFTLYRFEVNVRATAMVGFVGAGGIGDALHTAISLFHLQDLALLLVTMVVVVTAVDTIGDRLRTRILRSDHGHSRSGSPAAVHPSELDLETEVPAAAIPASYGGVLVAIEEVLEVGDGRLVVATAQELPEGQCFELTPQLPRMGAGTGPRLTVTAERVEPGNRAGFVYALTSCDAGEDASRWVDSDRTTGWHLHSRPAPLQGLSQGT
jgi:phosphonate transport system permease protein